MPENEFSINEDNLATIHNIRQLAEIILQKLTVLEGSVANITGITGIDCGEITVSNSGKPSSAAIANNKLFSDEDMGQFTSSISASIRAGTFENIVPGCYFYFSNVAYTYLDENDTTQNDTYTGRMRIMHLDYPQCCGDTATSMHNILVVPDNNMFNARMNPTDTTAGGYAESEMRTVHLRRAEAIFKACFGADHILSHREYLTNTVTNGQTSGGAWYNSTVELMDDMMLFGYNLYEDYTYYESLESELHLLERPQLAILTHHDGLIFNGTLYWLRNLGVSGCFATIAPADFDARPASTTTIGVRPYAVIY